LFSVVSAIVVLRLIYICLYFKYTCQLVKTLYAANISHINISLVSPKRIIVLQQATIKNYVY